MQSQAVGFDFLFYNDTLSSCSDYVVKQVSFFWQFLNVSFVLGELLQANFCVFTDKVSSRLNFVLGCLVDLSLMMRLYISRTNAVAL